MLSEKILDGANNINEVDMIASYAEEGSQSVSNTRWANDYACHNRCIEGRSYVLFFVMDDHYHNWVSEN